MQTHSEKVVQASGVDGVLTRELPANGNYVPAAGSITWHRRQENETGVQHLRRVRQLAETAKQCRGLAYTNNGSIGVRLESKTGATSWRASNLPVTLAIPELVSWVHANGFADCDETSVRRQVWKRQGCVTASFVFRAAYAGGPQSCVQFEASIDGGDDFLVSVEPFRPTTKAVEFKSMRSGAHQWIPELAQKPPAASATGPMAADATPDDADEKPKRAKGPDGKPVPVCQPTDDDGVLAVLGLSVHKSEADVACFWHSVAYHFAKAKKTLTTAAAIRTAAVDHLRDKSVSFEPLWDRMMPTREALPCDSWAKYLTEMRKATTWAGELEALAVCDLFKIQMLIVRPGMPSVRVGSSGPTIWLLFTNNHYDALDAEKHPGLSGARRHHVNGIVDGFNFKLSQPLFAVQRMWNMKSGAKSSSYCGTLRASSSSASKAASASRARAPCPTVRGPSSTGIDRALSQLGVPAVASATPRGVATMCMPS